MTSARAKGEASRHGRGRPQHQPLEPESPGKATANEDMLHSIRDMMNDLRTEIINKFESIISDSVKKEVAAALGPIEEKLATQRGTISDLEHSANDHEGQLTSLQAGMAKLSATVETLEKKCEDLESRSRWNNVRLVGLPEGSEGPNPTEYVSQLLMDLLNLDAKPVLDRAHRTLRAKPKEGEPPRPMIIRVNQFQVRNAILRRAGEASPLLHNSKRMFIFPDFTPAVAKRRAAFTMVKKELHSCDSVRFGLRYPAILHITLPDGRRHKFEDPGEALEFVNKRIKKITEPEAT